MVRKKKEKERDSGGLLFLLSLVGSGVALYSYFKTPKNAVLDIPGCTNPIANNFNPLANKDDGSCIVEGCTDPNAKNFDTKDTLDNGTCIQPILGCTDPKADNFNPLATKDDGSCVISGCTDPNATNFNPLATKDDGSCFIEGCTNPKATNFNPIATKDDGSCIIEGCTDPNAINFDPTATKDDGSCLMCKEGDLNCGNGDILEKCSNGLWVKEQHCTYGCENNACKPPFHLTCDGNKCVETIGLGPDDPGCKNTGQDCCKGNSSQCKGNSLETCKSGQWSGQSCAYGCQNNKCNMCSPLSKKNEEPCLTDISKIGKWDECSADGQSWLQKGIICPQPECQPNGITQCDGNSVQKCVNFKWQGLKSCANGCIGGECAHLACSNGTCKKVKGDVPNFKGCFSEGSECCTFDNDTRCKGNGQETCKNGQWGSGQSCQYGCSNDKCNSKPVCKSHSYQSCGKDGDVHWFDSCDNQEEETQDCKGYGCQNNKCKDPPKENVVIVCCSKSSGDCNIAYIMETGFQNMGWTIPNNPQSSGTVKVVQPQTLNWFKNTDWYKNADIVVVVGGQQAWDECTDNFWSEWFKDVDNVFDKKDMFQRKTSGGRCYYGISGWDASQTAYISSCFLQQVSKNKTDICDISSSICDPK